MRLQVVAIGRLKSGPERDLVRRYAGRVEALGRALGLQLDLLELPESRARRDADRCREEADLLLGRTHTGAALVALDERGPSLTSERFAERLASWRDAGRAAASFAIGGADGLDASVRERAEFVLSFGALTLPHQLVRVLTVEQLYRALTILAGHPYHRAGDP